MSEYKNNVMRDQTECFTTLDQFASMLIEVERELGLFERDLRIPETWDHDALWHPDYYPTDGEPQYRLSRLQGPLFDKVTAQMAAAAKTPRLLRPYSPLAFNLRPPQPREFIVPDWLPCGVTTKLDGAGGTGKSLLAYQLMVSCALGKPFLGLDVPQVRSLALFCEDDYDELGVRLERMNRALGITHADVAPSLRLFDADTLARTAGDTALMTFDGHTPVLTPLWHELRQYVLDCGIRLIALDTKHDVFRGEANDPQLARAFVRQACNPLARECNGAVLLLDHPSAAGTFNGTGESGSKQWEAAVRSRWYFKREQPAAEDPEPDPDVRTLTRMKANYAPAGGELRVRYRDGLFLPDGADGPEHWIDAKQRQNEVYRVFLDELAQAVDRGEDLTNSARAGHSYAPKRIKQTTAGKAFSLKDLTAAMHRALEDGDVRLVEIGKPSRPKKVLRPV